MLNNFDEIELIYLDSVISVFQLMVCAFLIFDVLLIVFITYSLRTHGVKSIFSSALRIIAVGFLGSFIAMAVLFYDPLLKLYNTHEGETIYGSVDCTLVSSVNYDRYKREYFCEEEGKYFLTVDSKYDMMGILYGPDIIRGEKYTYYYTLTDNKIFYRKVIKKEH